MLFLQSCNAKTLGMIAGLLAGVFFAKAKLRDRSQS